MTYQDNDPNRVNDPAYRDLNARTENRSYGSWIIGALALLAVAAALMVFVPHRTDTASNTNNGMTVSAPARVTPPASTTGSGTTSPSGPGTPSTTR